MPKLYVAHCFSFTEDAGAGGQTAEQGNHHLPSPIITKPEVLAKLSEEATVTAKQNFRFTTSQVQLITHMMDKHGTDYKAMARDPRNHFQETPAKLRGMIRKFISIPEHYAPYCKERGLLQTENSEGKEDDLASD